MKASSQNKLTRNLFLSSLAMAVIIFACTNGDARAKLNVINKDPEKPGVAAKINGEEISEEDFIGDAKMELMELKKKEYELRMERLKAILRTKLIGQEAAKVKMSEEEYLDKKVFGKISVSDDDVKKFIKERDFPEEKLKQQPEIRDQIVRFIENQRRDEKLTDHIAKLSKDMKIEVFFKKPEGVKLELGDAPMTGKKDAPVQIVAFSDFQCPYCSKGATVVEQLRKKYGKKINIAFKHYPLPFHPQATPTSEMSMCVNKVGGADKFWKFHDIAFKNQKSLDTESLLKYVKESGVKTETVKECFDKGEFKQFVQNDVEYGKKIGVSSTPTFFINGQMVAGAQPVEQFSKLIDDELSAQ